MIKIENKAGVYIVSGLVSRKSAEKIRDDFLKIADEYGMVTVADLYDLVGVGCSYTDTKIGWTSGAVLDNRFGMRVIIGCINDNDWRIMFPRINYDNNTKRRDDLMNAANASVMFGGKLYPAKSVDWIQTPAGEFPRIKVEATINPRDYACPSTRYANTSPKIPAITNVIFNPPATIVFWSDHTKTVVKCDYSLEDYDPEKGIAMAISKKMIGDNKYEYYNTFKHWLKKWDKQNYKLTVEEDFNNG